MIPISLSTLVAVVDGVAFNSSELLIHGECTIDSREVTPDGIFFAIKGEHVDGADFADQAFARGAAIVIAQRKVDGPCVVVADVVASLGKLAKYVREQLPALVVIGITGSQGKTTTKDLLSWVTALVGETVATRASYNNEIGLPLTLLECSPETQFCILEMGARRSGDIAHLCDIAHPNIGVVLKVGTAHLGEFGSQEIIAKTKGELIASLSKDGVAILGTYDHFSPHMADGLPIKRVTFGEGFAEDVRATDVEIREGRAHFDVVTPMGRAAVGLRVVGGHQVANALAVAAVATTLGISLDTIAGGLSTAEVASKWRMQIHEMPGLLVINDAYNANVDSMAAALRVLALFAQERGGQSWAFLGKMLELGESSAQEHAKIGTLAKSMGIDHLVCVDAPEYAALLNDADDTRVHQCSSISEALLLLEHFSPGEVVLVKASRAEKLELLADSLVTSWTKKMGEQE